MKKTTKKRATRTKPRGGSSSTASASSKSRPGTTRKSAPRPAKQAAAPTATAPFRNGGNGAGAPAVGAGRDAHGRFARGNPGGPGNPRLAEVHRLRTAMLEAVTEQDLVQIIRAMVDKAVAGDVVAAREVLDRCLGKPKQSLDIEAETTTRADAGPDIENMTDAEIAQYLRSAGIPLPPVLAAALARWEERERLEAAE